MNEDEPGNLPAPSAAFGRREFIVGAILAGVAGISFARLPRTAVIGLREGDMAGAVPRSLGPWRMIPPPENMILPPEDERMAAALYDDQLMRTYENDRSQQVMLLVAYARSQSSMLMVHRPESCYPGSGFTITSNEPATIPVASDFSINGRFLTAEMEGRIEQVLYWTRFGDDLPTDWDAQRQSIAVQGLKGLVPDGALVRMSIISPDAAGSLKLLQGFAAGMIRSSGPEGRGLLVGPANRGDGMA